MFRKILIALLAAAFVAAPAFAPAAMTGLSDYALAAKKKAPKAKKSSKPKTAPVQTNTPSNTMAPGGY